MRLAYNLSTVISSVLFLSYGISCLFSNGMAAEFRRFGLSRFRRLTGGLEVLGALGLLAGYVIPAIGIFSAAGLALLMLLGLMTRFRMRDSLLAGAPAAVLLLLNIFNVVYLWRSQFGSR